MMLFKISSPLGDPTNLSSHKAKNLSALLLGFSFMILCLSMCSCATTRTTAQLVHDVRIDTVYMTNQQYDSIYIYKEHSSDFKPSSLSREDRGGSDTVYLKDVSIEHRYKLLRDTVKVIQRDSIPYEVTVVETKEISRPLTWFDRLTRATFWLLCGALFVLFVKFVFRKNIC